MPEKIDTEAVEADTGLDPMAQAIADFAASLPPINEMPPEEARAMREKDANPLQPEEQSSVSKEDISIHGPESDLLIRIYRPSGDDSPHLPAIVYFHGGGFVMGSVDSHCTLSQNICAASGSIVISVEYRLAPETKYPGAVDDALAAYLWVYENSEQLGVDKDRIAVGGDSAGGNLAAVACLKCRNNDLPKPAAQLLIYPVIQAYADTDSMDQFADGYFLTKEAMTWFFDHYLEERAQMKDPDVSPILNTSLSDLPPAMVITAGFDPLRDEGKAYADRLEHDGVQVEHTCYTDMIHGFLTFAGGLVQGKKAIEECGKFLKEQFRSS